MTIVSEVLEGDGAALLLPRAYSELRTWVHPAAPQSRVAALPLDGGNAWMYLRSLTVSGQRQEHIRIVVGASYFEFLTTGKPVETYITIGSVVPFTAYKASVVGVDVRLNTAVIINGQKAENVVPNSMFGRPNQVALADEPLSYPSGNTLLYESYAPVSSHTGLWLRSWADMGAFTSKFDNSAREQYPDRGPLSPFTIRDIDFDIPLLYGAGKSKAKRAYINGDGVDWPRANGLQTVTHDAFGSRTFAIYGDAFGQFFIFPLSAIGPELPAYAQNVDSAAVQKFQPDLPTWCYTSSQLARQWWVYEGALGLVDFPETDWKFAHDGKKACAVVFERRPVVRDSAYLDDPATLGITAVTAPRFNDYRDYHTGAAAKFGVFYAIAHNPTRYSIAPGVVELTFDIRLTGLNQEDFSVTIFVDEIRRPTTSEYFTVLAGYSWIDVKATDFTVENQHYEARKGDMVVLDLERHYQPTSLVPHFSQGLTTHFLSLKNITKATELRSFPATKNINPLDGTPTTTHDYVAACQLVDFDLPTLSFALRIHFRSHYFKAEPYAGGGMIDVEYTVAHFGLSVYTLNRFRETLYPETISDYAKTELNFRKESSGRAAVTGFTRLPLNLMDGWSNTEYSAYRDWFLEFDFAKDFSPNAPQPADATLYLFEVGLAEGGTTSRGAFYPTDPCFAWNAYAKTFINLFHVSEQSTFFAHPSGVWAVYDQQYVYNKTGIPFMPFDITYPVPANTYDSLDVTTFEHVIFDRVHFSERDTTFLALYNKAVNAGIASDSLVADLQPATLLDLRATFTKNPIARAIVPPLTAAMIGVTWGGQTGYYLEGTYMKYTGTSLADITFGNQYGWQSPSLGDFFAENVDGSGRTDFFSATPFKFSSVAMA